MQNRIYRFAQFELNSSEGELRAYNAIIRLQDKPLRLLCALLDHPQRLVTREQLRERMWDSRTIVDFERGINVAVKKVRDALGDSAEKPVLIETVAKKGYRLLVPVSVVPPDVDLSTFSAPHPFAANPAVPEPLADSTASPSSGAGVSAKQAIGRRWHFRAIVAGILCALGTAFFSFQARPRHPVGIRSLAVLPLRDLSPGAGQEYFADGITEELITNLAQTLPLRVISRTSVMRYKRTNEPITLIARELGVEAIVEGAVTRSGNRVSVTVQLIDATEDRHLWAQKYERGTDDILAMEDELSQAIASQVGGKLSVQHARLANSQVDPQVYELCLMGRYHWNKRTEADLVKAEGYFQQAIARDSKYAPAYAGLAGVYALWPNYGTIAHSQSYAKANAAARHALELDDTVAEAHATLGIIGLNDRNSDWTQTGAELRRALQLNPSYANAHHWFAYYLLFSNHRDEALAEIELARELDPLSAIIDADEGHFLYTVHRYDEARIRLKQATELEPELGQPHGTLALVELETGHVSDALREANASLALDPNNPRTLGEAGYVLAATGETAAAEKLLATLKSLVLRGSAAPAFSALIEIGLGQREQALNTLVKEQGDTGGGPLALGQWHGFDALNTDPRYQRLLAKAP